MTMLYDLDDGGSVLSLSLESGWVVLLCSSGLWFFLLFLFNLGHDYTTITGWLERPTRPMTGCTTS